MAGVNYRLMLEYRVEILLWVVATALPLIMMGLWAQAGESGAFTLSRAEFIRYFLAVFVIRQLTVVWVIHEFEYEMVTGRLSPYLLWPVDPLWRYAASHFAEQAARLPLFLPLMGLALGMYPEALRDPLDHSLWKPPWLQWLGLPLVIVLAFAIRFIIQYTIALAAFWVERVQAFEPASYLAYLFLSGMIAPLEVFPDAVRAAAMWTPFPYLVWFPARLATQPLPAAMIVQSLLILGGWAGLLWLINRAIWRAGLRRYSAMGA